MILQVGGEDCLLDVAYDKRVRSRLDMWKYVVSGCVENHDAVIEVMLLHSGRRAVELRQRRVCLHLKHVVCAAMVQVVAQASNNHGQLLHVLQIIRDQRILEKTKIMFIISIDVLT